MRTAIAFVCLLAGSARAEPWYRGEHGNNRILHLSITVGGGVALFSLTGLLDNELAAECRWCGGPNRIDRGIRDAVVWSPDQRDQAARASNITSYIAPPLVGVGLVLAGTLDDPSWAQVIDDIVPIAESLIIAEAVTEAIKVSAARQRPYARFTGPSGAQDNVSFPSGHTCSAFALLTSAATVAHMRRYKVEPYLWAATFALDTATAYLRMAADRHYFSDVLVGGAIGASAGLTVPLLMRRREVVVVPTGTGAAVAGRW